MAAFGFGGGMLEEQGRISEKRADFTNNMAQLIAQNPDLDVQGLMQLVNNAAGTDNTLRGVFTPQTLTPYVEGRNRAKRVQIYNTLQQWLKENPGASVTDAQNAFYMFTGGNADDPQMLNGFLDQARRRNQLAEQQEQERKLGMMLQNRSAVEGVANEILLSTGDIEQAKTKFIQQFGTDSPYGISMDSLFTPQRMNELSTRKAIGILSEMDKMAGPNGDIRAYENIYANDLTGATGEAYKRLIEQRNQQKLQGYNKSLADVGGITETAKVAASSGADPKVAFEGYVFQQLGMSSKQAAEMGIDLSTAQRNFDDRFRYFKDEKSKQDEATLQQKRGEVENYWKGEFQLPMAVDKIKNGKTAELEAEILQSAASIPGFSALDAKKIVQDIMARTELVTRTEFQKKGDGISGQVNTYQEDLVKASKDSAATWWIERSKGIAESRGISDPAFAGLLDALAAEYDFSNYNVAATADKILTDWAATGGTTMDLRDMLQKGLSGTAPKITDMVNKRREDYEVQTGRFGQDKPISVGEFQSLFTNEIAADAEKAKARIDMVRGMDLNDPKQVDEAITILSNTRSALSALPGAKAQKLSARQKYTDWLRVGETVPPDLYASLARQAQEAYIPLERDAGSLLNGLLITKRQLEAAQQGLGQKTGANLDASKLPADVSSGFTPAPEYTPDAGSPIGRTLQAGYNWLTSQEPSYSGRIQQIANFHGGYASPLGAFRTQSDQQRQIHAIVTDVLNDPRARQAIMANPQLMDLIDPNSQGYNPQRFIDVWANAQKTDAAPAGTTEQPQ